jgi:hypothetical protein
VGALHNVRVFAEKMPPLAEAHPHVQDGLRLELQDPVNHTGDDGGAAAGHKLLIVILILILIFFGGAIKIKMMIKIKIRKPPAKNSDTCFGISTCHWFASGGTVQHAL